MAMSIPTTVDSDSTEDSEAERERLAREELERLATLPTEPVGVEFSREDLQKLIKFVKQITTLYDLEASDWTSECAHVITEWLEHPWEPALAIYFDHATLTAMLGFPNVPVHDLMYFLRDPNDVLTVQNFHENVTFGSINGSVEGSLLRVLECVYAPIFMSLSTWPESVKSEFCSSFHTFLAKLTELHYKMLGLTVIYIPYEGLDKRVVDACVDKDLVKRLDGVVVHWTRQLILCLKDQKQLTNMDQSGPADEYDFWVYRYENLCAIKYQLQNKNLKHIREILLAAESAYIKKFLSLSSELDSYLKEAKSNIEYLQIVKDTCAELEKISNPDEICKLIPKLLGLFRVIWTKSFYYNNAERITALCKSLSCQVIRRCTVSTNLKAILEGNSQQGIQQMKNIIKCCEKYKKIYHDVSAAHNSANPGTWQLSNEVIFNNLDSFIQRCQDVIEICHAMATIGRYDETKLIPKPLFGGTRGSEFERVCEKIERMFRESLDKVSEIESHILDVKSASWYEEMNRFREKTNNIEIIIENLVSDIFQTVTQMEEALESLCALYNYTRRKNLKPLFERITERVWEYFSEEIQDAKRDVILERETYPSITPYFAGRASMAKLKKTRLISLKKKLDDAEWLWLCPVAHEIISQYNKFMQSIEDRIKELHRNWKDSIGEDVTGRLNRYLMNRSATKMGLLECNIDRSILEICQEAQLWESLGYEISSDIKKVYLKYDNLKYVFESVMTIVLDYNRIINALSDKERLLFKQLILTCEKKINPGLHKVTWSSEVSETFIADCVLQTGELQAFLDDYKTSNLEIVKICEKVCDTPLIKMKPDYVYQLKELKQILQDTKHNTVIKILTMFRDIMNYMTVVYEGFEEYLHLMVGEWVAYVQKFDMLVEEALKVCVKNSLTVLLNALQGDGVIGPSPLLKLEVNLRDNRINFSPNVIQVASLVSNTLSGVIESMKIVPRLCKKFNVLTDVQEYYEVIEKDTECCKLQALLDAEMELNVQLVQRYATIWEPFRDLWEIDKNLFIQRYEAIKPSPQSFDSNLSRYTDVVNNVQAQESNTAVHFLTLNSSHLKTTIINHCTEWQKKLEQLLSKMATEKVERVYKYTKKYADLIVEEPTDLLELETLIDLYGKLVNEKPLEQAEFPIIEEQFKTLSKYAVEIPEEIMTNFQELHDRWDWYTQILEACKGMLEKSKDKFKVGLLESASAFKKKCTEVLQQFYDAGPFSHELSSDEAFTQIEIIHKKLEELKEVDGRLRTDLQVFNICHPESADLVTLKQDLNAIRLVWTITKEWENCWENNKIENFWTVETKEMQENSHSIFNRLVKIPRSLRDLRNWDIVDYVKGKVEAFTRTLSLLASLKNSAMRERHWTRIKLHMKKNFDQNAEDFNLEKMIVLNFQSHSEEICEISVTATMELQTECGIRNIAEIWEVVAIEMVPYKEKGMYKIKNVDECFQVLEEHAIGISAMKSTAFVEPFADEVDYWEKTLSYIGEVLEHALTVQRKWLYMENIFTGEDIRKQLPRESTLFDTLSSSWMHITNSMNAETNILKATHYEPPPKLLESLLELDDTLEELQRALEKYLETKRNCFPRFYFISNDDLLEILGNSRKPDNVQQHFKKLFDNITKIKMAKIPFTSKSEAIGMFSKEGEYIEFSTPLVLEGAVEAWMADIETHMRLVLKDLLKQTRTALRKNLNKRDKWLLLWPGQSCVTASQIQSTTDCTRTITICKITNDRKPLKKLRKKQNQILMKLSEMSRREVTDKIQRLKVTALITIEIHSRDVVDKLYKSNCTDICNFEWVSQLRFYWDKELDNCAIRQTNTQFLYNYEYLGNSERLVVTPLTDRCFITLTTALHLYRGGSPKGPAGTGKTETVKDLGKAMGMWVIVNNCSQGLDYKSMGKCFLGLAQTGAWMCFDEFNRINVEVLSVVAQQILSVLSALSQDLSRFAFEGVEVNLVPTIGLFITMDTDCAGRKELPDNLKSMFRPVSMIVPDTMIIAENTLFSNGFQQSRILARKVITVYQMAKQQLHKQDHYDFCLRSVVALLRYAGRKRRVYPQHPEEEILYLAMKDMNAAKLTANDLPLFTSILSDVFPGVQIPHVEYEEFYTCIEDEFVALGLQKTPAAIVKVIQLFETKVARHAVMVLGNSGSGKSTTWKVLKGALERMKKLEKYGFSNVEIYPMNPKSLTVAEIYGEFNSMTSEWRDGVLSAIMRKVCADESSDQKWILFDGPIDAAWIENMNSVLDDNLVLTLINSDRISMPPQVSLLFEADDLRAASPATISRCGIVYNDYKDWGWKPYITSWLNKQPDQDHFVAEIKTQFDKTLDAFLKFKRLKCEEIIKTTEINNIISLCKMLDCLATQEKGATITDYESFQTLVKLWFLFCLIWSVGATLTQESREKVDTLLRELEGVHPVNDTVYEYYVDAEKKCMVHWNTMLEVNWKYSAKIPFDRITVPTVDTVRYEYLSSALLRAGAPTMLVGPVGSGKTFAAHSVLDRVNTTRLSHLCINMSAQTTSENLQNTIEARVEKRTKGVFVPIGGKTLVIFMDDFNMPTVDSSGAQPPLELIRQWIDYGFWYDKQRQYLKCVKDLRLLAAMSPPGGGRNTISQRLLSKFNIINLTFPSDDQLYLIFGTMLNQQLADFDEETKHVGENIAIATISLYHNVLATLLPTPAKMHYLFNIREISRVFQGMLRCNKDFHNTKATILRLWIHECTRVFSDRLIDDKDTLWFNEEMGRQLGEHFETTFHAICPNDEAPVFTDCLNPHGIYQDVLDLDKIRNYIQTKMDEYNTLPGVVRMNVVLFKDAVHHICRMVRVLSQRKGNMLLIGIDGSGRYSISRIGCFICDLEFFQVEAKHVYKMQEFKNDLKCLYDLAGIKCKPTSFLFSDRESSEEAFWEIINNLLSTGEVHNLYTNEEFEQVKANLTNVMPEAGKVHTNESFMSFIVEQVKANLHFIINMSPIGEHFRNRLRQYPSIINCTTIDWYHAWPQEALLEVAQHFIQKINIIQTAINTEIKTRLPPRERLCNAIAQVFTTMELSARQQSEKMFRLMKRYNYITSSNYLQLVTGYISMLVEKREEVSARANLFRNGLSQIDVTKLKVRDMSVDLEEAQLKATECQMQCEQNLAVIVTQTEEVEEQQRQVSAKVIKIAEEEAICKDLAYAINAGLEEVMPTLEEALLALESIDKNDMAEVKTFTKPPPNIEMVMDSIMILLQCEPTWTEAKKHLADPKFIEDLTGFDKNNISDDTLKRITEYTTNEQFEPDAIGQISTSAKTLCFWVKAIEGYGQVYKVIGPKQNKLSDVTESLKQNKAWLAEAQPKLDQLSNTLSILKMEYEEKLTQREELNQIAENLTLKIERGKILIEGLTSEGAKWEEKAEGLEDSFDRLIGDCLISSAFLSYVGPFPSEYRKELLELWEMEIVEQKIPLTENFSIQRFLSDSCTIREWNILGLPNDNFSTENGIIATCCSRWPLIIDPQCLAVKWIRAMETERGELLVIDFEQKDFIKSLETSIQFGYSILLENVKETLDPIIKPILKQAIIKESGQLMIKLNNKLISYNPKFKLYLTTKLPNPHFAPEITAQITIINFTIKQEGLESLLLGILVDREKPHIEEMKLTSTTTITKNERVLTDIENNILKILHETTVSLVDNEELFTMLQTSRKISLDAKLSLEESEKTERSVDSAKEVYKKCSNRASILFFVLMDLCQIDSMYQFSLDAYIQLFVISIDKSSRAQELDERIAFINEYHTYAIYRNISRALFQNHKLLFSFHMCIKLLEAEGKVNDVEYKFLLKGAASDKSNQMENPCQGWLPDLNWDNIVELDRISGLTGVVNSFQQSSRDWREWYINSQPETQRLVGNWEVQCSIFQKLLFIRALRSDRISFCITKFISSSIGLQYVEPPTLDVKEAFEESVNTTPLFFILAPGVDPTASFIQLSKVCDMQKRYQTLSLGQGQAAIATRMIAAGIREGYWIFLANCHLSITWLPKLEKIVQNLQFGEIHRDFRLWLSSTPLPDFPISILQSSIKMTTEPPRGIKANLKRFYENITEEQLQQGKPQDKYKRLLFSLCYFHCVLLERKKFQQLGWNSIYSFNDSDLEISKTFLTVFLDEYPEETSLDAMKYLIASVNYGGHMTEEWDQRLLQAYANQYICEDVMKVPHAKLSSLSTYFIPKDGDLESYLDFINSLPQDDRPEAFGQHPNAEFSSLSTEARYMCDALLSIELNAGENIKENMEDKVCLMVQEVLKKIPSIIDYDHTEMLVGNEKTPLDVVLLQEIQRYTFLLSSITTSLGLLEDGIKGLVVMSAAVQDTFHCILEGKVPSDWLKAYPSSKRLGSWLQDLILRIEFFASWAETTKPPAVFWLAAFTYPTAFLTAVLQKSARCSNTPIDWLGWEFIVSQNNAISVTAPSEGVYVRGIYLEGAGWELEGQCLAEPEPMQLVYPMPLIHFIPVENFRKKNKGIYVCPTYYYPQRAGTPARPAFVVSVDLKSGDESPDFWVKRGTAMLLSLAD